MPYQHLLPTWLSTLLKVTATLIMGLALLYGVAKGQIFVIAASLIGLTWIHFNVIKTYPLPTLATKFGIYPHLLRCIKFFVLAYVLALAIVKIISRLF